MKTKAQIYRGETLQQNPLTGDWLVMLPEPYGAYCGTLSGMRKVIDRYIHINAHQPEQKGTKVL